ALRDKLEPSGAFVGAVALAERLGLAPVPGDDRGCRGNAARCAAELALLDAYGRHFGEPLAAATRLVEPELYRPRPSVRYSGAITSSDGLKLKLVAWPSRFSGYRRLKAKAGTPGQADPARLRALRRRVGNKVELRVDANEAWPPADAAERVRELEPFGIACVEQPVPHEVVDSLAQ